MWLEVIQNSNFAQWPQPRIHANLSYENFTREWNNYVNEIQIAAQKGPVLAFVVYSGHGMIHRMDQH